MKRQSEILMRHTGEGYAPASAAHDLAPAEIMGPMIAGARARGIADAYEMMGLGIVMMNASGRVLYSSPRAQAMMQGLISIVSDHMVGATPETNIEIETIIESTLAQDAGVPVKTIIESSEGLRIVLRIARVPVADDHAFQLLKVVIVVSAD